MSGTSWSIVEYRGRQGLEQLEPHWRRLYASLEERSRYHAYEAQVAYVDHLCTDPERVRYLALTDGGGMVHGVCPLEATGDLSLRLPLRAWALPSHDHWLATDVLAASGGGREALLPAVVAYLRRHREGRSLLLLGPMRADRHLGAAAAGLPPRGRCLHDTHPSASFDCSLPYQRLLERMSKHFRRNLRGHKSKLEAAGKVRLTMVSGAQDVERLDAEFENFLAIEASGWKGRAGAASAIGLRPHLVDFYRALLATMVGPRDHCEINSLHLDGRCIAAQFCTRVGREYTILKIAYDEQFAHLGPGQLLLQTTLERCCGDPDIDYIDLITDAPWMRDWQTELMPMRQAHVSLSPVWGRLLIALLWLRHGPARRLVQRYRAAHADGRDPKARRRSIAQPDGDRG